MAFPHTQQLSGKLTSQINLPILFRQKMQRDSERLKTCKLLRHSSKIELFSVLGKVPARCKAQGFQGWQQPTATLTRPFQTPNPETWASSKQNQPSQLHTNKHVASVNTVAASPFSHWHKDSTNLRSLFQM